MTFWFQLQGRYRRILPARARWIPAMTVRHFLFNKSLSLPKKTSSCCYFPKDTVGCFPLPSWGRRTPPLFRIFTHAELFSFSFCSFLLLPHFGISINKLTTVPLVCCWLQPCICWILVPQKSFSFTLGFSEGSGFCKFVRFLVFESWIHGFSLSSLSSQSQWIRQIQPA